MTPDMGHGPPLRAGGWARIPRAVAGHLFPGVGRVHARVPEFADAWLASNDEAMAGSGPLWVALGDSMSQGIGARSFRGGWVGQLHAQFLMEGYRVRLVNLSSTGARVRDVVETQLPRLGAIDPAPALVTVLVGANDMIPRNRRAEAATSVRRFSRHFLLGGQWSARCRGATGAPRPSTH